MLRFLPGKKRRWVRTIRPVHEIASDAQSGGECARLWSRDELLHRHRHRRHLHRPRHAFGRWRRDHREIADHAERSNAGRVERARQRGAADRYPTQRAHHQSQVFRARHNGGHQRLHRTQGRQDRPADHARLCGYVANSTLHGELGGPCRPRDRTFLPAQDPGADHSAGSDRGNRRARR